MIWKWLPLIGVMLFLGILCWRSWWQRRRYGSRGVLFFQSQRWQDKLRDAGGIALLVVAQLNLGASWRIGIEESSNPGLVTSGFYRFCRNPIFFAILIMLAGYTLLLPTRLSLALLVGSKF